MGEIKTNLCIAGAKKEKCVDFVVDSGASASIISSDILKEIGSQRAMGFIKGIAIDNREVEYPAYNIIIKTKNYDRPVLIGENIHSKENILGHDFLQQVDAQIDEKNRKLIFPEKIRF